MAVKSRRTVASFRPIARASRALLDQYLESMNVVVLEPDVVEPRGLTLRKVRLFGSSGPHASDAVSSAK